MKKFFLLGVMVCAIGMFTACKENSEKTSLERDNLHGKVKSAKVSFYEAQVKFGEVQAGELKGNYKHPLYYDWGEGCIIVTNYDENGMSTCTDYYDDDMELAGKSVYTFENRKLIDWKSYDKDGELVVENMIVFDENTGKEKEQFLTLYLKYDSSSYHYLFTYDNEGTLHGEAYKKDSLTDKWSYKQVKNNGKLQKAIRNSEQGDIINIYDDNERVVSMSNGITGDSLSYVYNENGDVEQMTETKYEYKDDNYTMSFDSDNDAKPERVRKTTEYKFEYEYDNHKNWTKRITYKGIKPIYIEEREIEYYK